jgi:arsenate reductase
VTDLAHRMIYLPQPEVGPHDSRALAVQAFGHVVLDHQVPRDYAAFLEQRVEINYFAAALLIPERGALILLRKAKAAKDIAIEDLRDAYAVSYETAAHRFTNLATCHLDIPVHFMRIASTDVMAAAFVTHLSPGAVEVRSAGSEPADRVNPAAVAAMAEVGIDIAAEQPKILTTEAFKASDVVITMGCGDTCPFYPGKRYEDWVLEDPAGKGVDAIRPIRDEIKRRVQKLISELVPTSV